MDASASHATVVFALVKEAKPNWGGWLHYMDGMQGVFGAMSHDGRSASARVQRVDGQTAFHAAARDLRALFSAEENKAWLEQLAYAGEADGVVYLRVSTGVARDWLVQNALHQFEAHMAKSAPQISGVVIAVQADLPASMKQAVLTAIAGGTTSSGSGQTPVNQTFDTYCVGDANRAAVFAAKSIAEGVGAAGQLVLFHGTYGGGKTHLGNAIVHEALRRNPNRRVRLMNTILFVEEFQNGLSKRRDLSAFKAQMRDIDLLILDDVQRVAGKAATESELVDTIAVLLAQGAQVVMTADHGPAGLDGFDVRLKSQLRGAADFFIDAPDFELRRKILEAKLKLYAVGAAAGLHAPDHVLDMIASRIRGPGRALDGAIRQIVMELGFANKEVTLESAERVLRGRFEEPPKRTTVESIIGHTAKHYGLTKDQLLTPTHQRSIARPRQVAMYLCRKMTRRSLPDLAIRFGGKHHTTVLYASGRIETLMKEDDQLRRDVEVIGNTIRAVA